MSSLTRTPRQADEAGMAATGGCSVCAMRTSTPCCSQTSRNFVIGLIGDHEIHIIERRDQREIG